MDALSRRAAQNLLGENICLDFINPVVLDADTDFFFSSYGRLVDWGTAAGTIGSDEAEALRTAAEASAEAANQALDYAKSVRESLDGALRAAASSGSVRAHLPALNEAMAVAAVHRRLAEQHNRIVWDWPFDGDLGRLLWPVIPTAIELLMSADLNHLKVCPGCSWLFLDSSKNHSRKWCRMSDCGNVAKVRSHRRRGLSQKNIADPGR